MKASKLTDAQKTFTIRQGEDGVPVAEICRKAGISQATYFNWTKKCAGFLPDEMRHLKQLEDENNRLKKIVADLTLAERCCRTSSNESAFACPPLNQWRADVHPARMRTLVDEIRAEWMILFDPKTDRYRFRRLGFQAVWKRSRMRL